MAVSESSSVASASAAPPKMSTEFSRPRRPKRRCSILTPLSSVTLLSYSFSPLYVQSKHLERPHPEAHGALMDLYRPSGFFEEVDSLYPLDAAGEAQRTFSAGAVGLVEAQDHNSPLLRQLEAPERELQFLRLHE